MLTFFTVRGGSGKTVLSAAFASYASYILGKRTMILDFDGPEYNLYNMRLRELSLMKEGDADCDKDELYIVEKVENTDSDILETNSASHSVPNALSINTFRNKCPVQLILCHYGFRAKLPNKSVPNHRKEISQASEVTQV